MGKIQHGHAKRPANRRLYRIWSHMKNRCYNKNDHKYSRYGGRGIIVCDEWHNDFQAFHDWAIQNGYSTALTIDRIDNDGNYEPCNCRWATMNQQEANRSNNNPVVGVSFDKSTKLYRASLMINRQYVLRKWCKTKNEAIQARKLAEQQYQNQFSEVREMIEAKKLFNH